MTDFFTLLWQSLHDVLRWPGSLGVSEVMRLPWLIGGDLLAVFVCAVTGVLKARRMRMDIVGVSAIAVVSGLGGGTLRDLLLGRGPVFWLIEPQGVAIALLAGWITFFIARRQTLQKSLFEVPDAFGLGLFTILGTEKALAAGHGWLVATLLGVMTGTVGGVLRDVLCNEVPSLFVGRQLYATTAVAGALVFIVCRVGGLPDWNCALIGTLVVAALRLCSLRWDWRAPGFDD